MRECAYVLVRVSSVRACLSSSAHNSRDVVYIIVSFSPRWMDSLESVCVCATATGYGGLSVSHSNAKCFTL